MPRQSSRQTRRHVAADDDDTSQRTRTKNRPERTQAKQAKAERDLLAAQREQQAVELRLQGYEFEEIARQCGYTAKGKPNKSAAYGAWKRALRKIPEPSVHAVRKQKVMAYNVARRALWASFSAGEQDAIDSWLALDKREADLMGLDARHDQGGHTPTVVQRFYPSAWADAAAAAPLASEPEPEPAEEAS